MSEHYSIESSANGIQYGFLSNPNTELLVIKVGSGGSIYGYQNKYFRIAHHFHSAGYNVLCCSTPPEINDSISFQTLFDIAHDLLSDKFADTAVCYFGVSRGAYQGITFADTVPQIKSLLLVNPPMALNFSKQISALRSMAKKCTVVIGGKDPSAKFLPLLTQIQNPNLDLKVISDADHHFCGLDEVFFNLPVSTFLKDK